MSDNKETETCIYVEFSKDPPCKILQVEGTNDFFCLKHGNNIFDCGKVGDQTNDSKGAK